MILDIVSLNSFVETTVITSPDGNRQDVMNEESKVSGKTKTSSEIKGTSFSIIH